MKEALASVFSSLNILGSRSERENEVVHVFRTTHRTLQQQFVSIVIIPILRHLSDSYKAGQCDGRNMAAGRLASLMLKDLNDDDLYLPYI